QRLEAMAQNLPAAIVVPVVQDMPEQYNIRSRRVRPREEIRRRGGKAIRQATALNMLLRDRAHWRQIHHDPTQVRMLEADGNSDATRSTGTVQQAAVGRKIAPLSDG